MGDLSYRRKRIVTYKPKVYVGGTSKQNVWSHFYDDAFFALCRLFIEMIVTKHLRSIRILKKQQQNLQGKLQK